MKRKSIGQSQQYIIPAYKIYDFNKLQVDIIDNVVIQPLRFWR